MLKKPSVTGSHPKTAEPLVISRGDRIPDVVPRFSLKLTVAKKRPHPEDGESNSERAREGRLKLASRRYISIYRGRRGAGGVQRQYISNASPRWRCRSLKSVTPRCYSFICETTMKCSSLSLKSETLFCQSSGRNFWGCPRTILLLLLLLLSKRLRFRIKNHSSESDNVTPFVILFSFSLAGRSDLERARWLALSPHHRREGGTKYG